jgi:subtilisin family serine protease
MIVRIKPAAAATHVSATGLAFKSSDAKAVPEAVSAPLEYLRKNAGLRSVSPVFSRRREQLERAAASGADRSRLAVLSSVVDSTAETLGGINVCRLDAKKVTPGLIKHLRAAPSLDIVEPMPARWLQATARADPLQNRQWALRAISWFEASLVSATEIKVAVLDTGIDDKHPDLEGTVDDYFHKGLSVRDLIGHGTHVGGIIAATVNNDEGIVGKSSATSLPTTASSTSTVSGTSRPWGQ